MPIVHGVDAEEVDTRTFLIVDAIRLPVLDDVISEPSWKRITCQSGYTLVLDSIVNVKLGVRNEFHLNQVIYLCQLVKQI